MKNKRTIGVLFILGLILLVWKVFIPALPAVLAMTMNIFFLALFLIGGIIFIYGVVRILKWCFK